MIGTRTPFRMSFIGGGSDLKEFYSRYHGEVLSTTINKYMYIFIHPFFDDRIQVKYSKTELVDNIENIKHPIVKEALKKYNLTGIDINSIADIPAGSGLGSSSSYTVGLLHALRKYLGKPISSEILAKDACEIEVDILKGPIGKQDQYAAAYGGLNHINFLPTGEVNVEPINMEKEVYHKLQKYLILFYTGKTRDASNILKTQKENIIADQTKFDILTKMTDLVSDAKKCFYESDLDGFGRILDKNWLLKKTLSKKISDSNIDDVYRLAKKCGATGGKILGAGGGGFILFYCKSIYQNELRLALNKLKEVTFKFENSGSKTIDFK